MIRRRSSVRRPRPRLAFRLALVPLLPLLVVACATAGPGRSGGPAAGTGCPTAQPAPLAEGETRTVTIATSKGPIVIAVEGDLSPLATGNFVALAGCGYYDGVVFHRILPGFVVQGGDGEFGRVAAYDADRVGTGGPGYAIRDEPVTSVYARGTVAMARSGPNSVGSQFFIVLADDARQSLAAPGYNNFQIIGTVTSGMEAVDAIAAAADAEQPSRPIVMDSVTVRTP